VTWVLECDPQVVIGMNLSGNRFNQLLINGDRGIALRRGMESTLGIPPNDDCIIVYDEFGRKKFRCSGDSGTRR
jgi:hypothetical protein